MGLIYDSIKARQDLFLFSVSSKCVALQSYNKVSLSVQGFRRSNAKVFVLLLLIITIITLISKASISIVSGNCDINLAQN